MRKLFAALLVAAGIAAAPVPACAQAKDSGFSLAARVGYGFPMGNVASDPTATLALADDFSGEAPLWLDVGYRFGRNFFVGAYFQYAFAFVKSSTAFAASQVGQAVCELPGVSCSGSDVRLGAEFQYSFSPEASFQPWAGIGFGYEWTNLSASAPGVEASLQYHGWELLNLQVGGDFKVSEAFALGPFVAFSLGQYDTVAVSATGQASQSIDIPSSAKSTHEWLQFGVKGTFNL